MWCNVIFFASFHRGSYTSVQLLLNLINELGGGGGGEDKIRGFAEYLVGFPQRVNKFNNTGARIQDSIYHMTLRSC